MCLLNVPKAFTKFLYPAKSQVVKFISCEPVAALRSSRPLLHQRSASSSTCPPSPRPGDELNSARLVSQEPPRRGLASRQPCDWCGNLYMTKRGVDEPRYLACELWRKRHADRSFDVDVVCVVYSGCIICRCTDVNARGTSDCESLISSTPHV